jgi:transposase InsO family protein
MADISKFAIASGKIYLSIIRDCYNDEIISWKIAEEHLPDLPIQLLKMLLEKQTASPL